MHPVAHPQAAVRPHLGIGGEDMAKGLLFVDRREARALGSNPKGADRAVGRPAAEIAEQEALVEMAPQPGAGIERQP